VNLWRCEAEGCKSTAVGVGPGINLIAIGWHAPYGGRTYCPVHRPDFDPSVPYAQSAGKKVADHAERLLDPLRQGDP
jgi:hypothetical protein